jgi:hypothetical protein
MYMRVGQKYFLIIIFQEFYDSCIFLRGGSDFDLLLDEGYGIMNIESGHVGKSSRVSRNSL